MLESLLALGGASRRGLDRSPRRFARYYTTFGARRHGLAASLTGPLARADGTAR